MTYETGAFTKQPTHLEPSHNEFRGNWGVVVNSFPQTFPCASIPYHGTQTSQSEKTNTGNRTGGQIHQQPELCDNLTLRKIDI